MNIIKLILYSLICIAATTVLAAAEKPEQTNIPFRFSAQPEWLNLLHYKNGKSVINADSNFFLSPEGFKNPQAEYSATVTELFNSDLKGDDSVFCRYPARAKYILKTINYTDTNITKQECYNYSEYLQKVPLDKVFIVFAAENNLSPSSMLGHVFLKISGKKENITVQHSFSYFALTNDSDSLDFYISVITTGLNGSYALSPYQTKADEYLFNEKRSLWEFELNLSPEEKESLKQHLWELKGKNIRYKFITHNCSTALESILKVANNDFAITTAKPFTTPVEYIQYLYKKGKIADIALVPSDTQKNVIKKFGLNYVGHAPNPTRISLSQDLFNNIANINFSPVYQDIRDISDAYFPDLESKMFDISLDYYNKSGKFALNKIDLLRTTSVIDYPVSKSYSKYFRLGFESNLFSERTNLKPVIEFGLGAGKKFTNTTFFILPKIGYHYDKLSNYYIAPQIGTISRTDKIKIINSYEKYFNSAQNNHGFDAEYNLYIGYKTPVIDEVYINYSYFHDAKYSNSLSIGLSLHF